ncbi:MAG: acyl carrier protein [Elusimicrobia bacterium]|nr:acyl carrier protein [Elusimicrobiota bacterium]
MTLEELVRKTLAVRPGLPITDDDGPGTIDGWDSVGHIKLVAAIESAYRVKLRPNDVIRIGKLSDIKRILKEKGAASV